MFHSFLLRWWLVESNCIAYVACLNDGMSATEYRLIRAKVLVAAMTECLDSQCNLLMRL